MKKHSLARNIVTNSASYLTTIVAAFIMFPVMIQKLGPARYGLWMLISEVTGYYSYIGLAIRSGVVYYAALYLAQGKQREVNGIAFTSIAALSCVGALVAASSFALAAAFPVLFGSSGLDLQETRDSIVIMAFAVALSLPLEAMNSTLTAAKRLDLVNTIEMTTRAVSSVLMLVCVLRGDGLVALSWIQLGSRIVAVPWALVAMRRVIPGLSLAPMHWHWGLLKSLASYGLPSILIGLGWLVSSRTDLAVVGMVLGIQMVPYYAIPRSLMEYADAGVRAIAWSFSSHLTHLHADDKESDLVQLYVRGSRLTGMAVFLLTGCLAAFGEPFLAIWQGSAFTAGDWRNRPGVVLLILLAAFLPRLLSNMTSQLFYATNRLRPLAWISVLEGVLKIVLSLLLVRPWGLAGVAISNLIPMLLFEGVAMPLILFRTYSFALGPYFRNVILRPLIAGATAFAAGTVLVAYWPPSTWGVFLSETSLTATLAIGMALTACTSAEERGLLRERLRAFRGMQA